MSIQLQQKLSPNANIVMNPSHAFLNTNYRNCFNDTELPRRERKIRGTTFAASVTRYLKKRNTGDVKGFKCFIV